MVGWLQVSAIDKTVTMRIKGIFFSLLTASLLWPFDFFPRSIKCLRGAGVVRNQLCRCPLGGWRTFHKNENRFPGRPSQYMNWRSDLFTGQFTGLLKCSHSDWVPPDVSLVAQWCQINHQHSQLESFPFHVSHPVVQYIICLSTLFTLDWRIIPFDWGW